MGVVLFLIVALTAFAAVCWVLAFLWNMFTYLGDSAAVWLRRWVDWRRRWRGFKAAYREEFSGPEFAWPASLPAPRSGPIGGAR